MNSKCRLYQSPPQEGFYVLRDPQGVEVDRGEDCLADFCIRARQLGRLAEVEEIQHPNRSGTPFGFHYVV